MNKSIKFLISTILAVNVFVGSMTIIAHASTIDPKVKKDIVQTQMTDKELSDYIDKNFKKLSDLERDELQKEIIIEKANKSPETPMESIKQNEVDLVISKIET